MIAIVNQISANNKILERILSAVIQELKSSIRSQSENQREEPIAGELVDRTVNKPKVQTDVQQESKPNLFSELKIFFVDKMQVFERYKDLQIQ